ncbi:hypothetical protein [Blastococcus saxobsidens]|uniref:Uncharacterized protein n=1 Tax=Blastococcus saxobsidens (strain DD2) TaxID=1146883 RepID=H6RVF0_BLASD|nr:hypothetical protein [Blastococcus saxobsidens]CCG02027.1 protein of unknown function [Blastococcus saxobsidens DD2]
MTVSGQVSRPPLGRTSWPLTYLYDHGADEDPPEFDPSAQVVFATASTIIVRGLPEAEGDVRLRIVFDESAETLRTPELLATGVFAAPSGQVIARTSSWDEPIQVAVAPGSYRFTVRSDDDRWPTEVLIQFERAAG